MSKIIFRNQSCECGSENARQIYTDGSFCFSCNKFFPPTKGVDMRNGADTAVTADRVSQHQKSDKAARKRVNVGLGPYVESHLESFYPKVDDEITSGNLIPLVKAKFPNADKSACANVLAILCHKKKVVRINGKTSGVYQRVASEVVNVLHVPNPDELGDQLIAAATALIELAKQRNLLAEKARKYDELMLKFAEFK
jgi:hypothetical protein